MTDRQKEEEALDALLVLAIRQGEVSDEFLGRHIDVDEVLTEHNIAVLNAKRSRIIQRVLAARREP